MKPVTLLTLAAQVVYVFSMPQPVEDGIEESSNLEDRYTEPADTLTKRAQCWYKKHPNYGYACSKDGYCYGHCNLQGPDNGEWCWWVWQDTEHWVTCKTNADCSTAWVKPWGKGPKCSGKCYCE